MKKEGKFQVLAPMDSITGKIIRATISLKYAQL